MPPKVAYIVGPFRASSAWGIEQNIRRAEEVALELWRIGYAVICPHTNTRFFQGAAPDVIWLNGDIEIMKRCDIVVAIEGYDKSEGSLKEVEIAEECGLPTMFWDTENSVAPNLIPLEYRRLRASHQL